MKKVSTKEQARLKLVITAKELAKIAVQKEKIRLELVVTAKELAKAVAVQKKEAEKKYEVSLQEEVERYATLMNTTDMGYVTVDSRNIVLNANPAYLKLTGHHNLKEIIGKNINGWVAKYDQKRNTSEIKKCFKHKFIKNLEMDYKLPNGKIVPVEINAAVFKSGKSALILTLSRDITERKKVNVVLKEGEVKYHQIFDGMSEAVVVYDVINNGRDIVIKDFNKAAEKIEKVNKIDIIGKKVDQVFKGVKEFGLYDVFLKVWKTGKPVRYPVTFYKDAYHKGWRENYVYKLLGNEIVAIYSDVTKQKNNDEILRESEEKYRSFIENHRGIAYKAFLNGMPIMFDGNVLGITGHDKKEFLSGKIKWQSMILREDLINISKTWKDLATKPGQALEREYRIKKKNGEIIWIEDLVKNLKDEKGKIKYVQGALYDITERKKLDKAKSQFVSLTSHQLRTPPTAINWYAEMLLSEEAGPLNEKQKKYVNEIHNGNQRIINMINTFLNASQIQLGTINIKPELVNVVDSLKDIFIELEPIIINKELVIKKGYKDDEAIIINTDRNLLHIILDNLISNAVNYTSKGGISIIVKKVNTGIHIEVADTGCGIPKEVQAKIFGEFFRADNARNIKSDGSGLGLYITKSFLELLGGNIKFKSEEGKGTTFFVDIPSRGMAKTKLR